MDFGYILGRDPKPYPPPVKVCKEMVDAMGGTQSVHYQRFQSLAYTAFINLRKNANLILNLVALMVDAGIQDIQLEPDKAVWKVSCVHPLTVEDAEIGTGAGKIHAGPERRGRHQAVRGPAYRHIVPHCRLR